jgi:hypothetical protein
MRDKVARAVMHDRDAYGTRHYSPNKYDAHGYCSKKAKKEKHGTGKKVHIAIYVIVCAAFSSFCHRLHLLQVASHICNCFRAYFAVDVCFKANIYQRRENPFSSMAASNVESLLSPAMTS